MLNIPQLNGAHAVPKPLSFFKRKKNSREKRLEYNPKHDGCANRNQRALRWIATDSSRHNFFFYLITFNWMKRPHWELSPPSKHENSNEAQQNKIINAKHVFFPRFRSFDYLIFTNELYVFFLLFFSSHLAAAAALVAADACCLTKL